MPSLTGMIQRREWRAVVSLIKRNPSEASVEELHLHEACKYDPPKSVIEVLVRSNSRFRTAADENGEYPIHTACFYGASEEVVQFLAHWDNQLLSARSRVSNQTPLEIAQTTVWESNGDNQGCVIRLLQKETFPAFFDDLTGLPKKKAFEEWAHVSPFGKFCAFVFFIDIAGFKFLNDTGGQNVGDEAIKMYASSIERECRTFEASWTSEKGALGLTIDVFRAGGDEFVVVVKTAADEEKSSLKLVWKAICNTLLPNLGSLKESNYHTFVRVGCSAGMVSTSRDTETLRERAEILQNEVKAQLKTTRGEEALLTEFQAESISKVKICNRLLELGPFTLPADCDQTVVQSMQSAMVKQEDSISVLTESQQVVAQSLQSAFVRREQIQKECVVNYVYFHLQPAPTVKDAYKSIDFETKHTSFLKMIENQVNDPEQKAMFEDKWNALRNCRMILSNGKATTLRSVLHHTNLRAIIWCAAGVDVNANRDVNGVISSIASAKQCLMFPDVVVVILRYSPERAAQELQRRGVRTVIWVRLDVYEHEPWIILSKLFLPICDAILAGKDPRESLEDEMNNSTFFANLHEQRGKPFGIAGATIPQQVHHSHVNEVMGLHAELRGCELCRTNVLELMERESFMDLDVRSSDLQSLADIKQFLYKAASEPRQSCAKRYIQLSSTYLDVDDTGLDRARAIAWETCKHFTTNHSELFPGGVFRVSSISDTQFLSSIKHKLRMCVLLWVDLSSGFRDEWKIDFESEQMLREIGDQCRRLLVIFTGDGKRLEEIKLMKNRMGLKHGFRPELARQLLGTDMPASSLHHCISIIPILNNACESDTPLLDIVLRDPANFEMNFRQIVLSCPIEVDAGTDTPVEDSVWTDSPPIVAVYYDDNDHSIKVRVCFSDIKFLMRLCGRILSGDGMAEKLSDAIDIRVRFDRTAFARVYEKALLQLENMTSHQREKTKFLGGRRIVHINARAGSGKTFLALNNSLAFLRKHKDKILLYASSSEALCLFFVKWLCKRCMQFEDLEFFLARLFLLYPSKRGEAAMVGVEYDEERRKLKRVKRTIPIDKGGKVIVDEAHHVFDQTQENMHLVASKATEMIEDKNFEVLVLSDRSQSSSSTDYEWNYPSEVRKTLPFELEEVVRSCQRIVAGAMTYQLISAIAHCAHDVDGPPLMTYIFDPEKYEREEIQVYADKVVEAINDLLGERFQNFNLHDRLAILLPDDLFRDQLKSTLEEKLEATLGQKFHLETALENSESLNLGDIDVSPLSPETRRCIVLDTVSNFHGQERLIVFGVDLDRPIEERGAVGFCRSQIYQAITRSQMVFCLINKRVRGGWFEWLQNMEDNDGTTFSFENFVKFHNQAAASSVVERFATEQYATYATSNSAAVAHENKMVPKDVLEPHEPAPAMEPGQPARKAAVELCCPCFFYPQGILCRFFSSAPTKAPSPRSEIERGPEAEPLQDNIACHEHVSKPEPTPKAEHECESKDAPDQENENDKVVKEEEEHNKDALHHDAQQSDETNKIRNLLVWDTSKNDRMLGASSGSFVPIEENVHTLVGHTQAVGCCAVFADSARAISGSGDETLKVWDVERGAVIRTLRGHTDTVNCCAVFDDGTRAISGSSDKTLKVWDVDSDEVIRTLECHFRGVNCCAVFADNTRAISGSHDMTLRVWDVQRGRKLRTLLGHVGNVICCAVFADGTRAISGGSAGDNTLKVWDLASGRDLAVGRELRTLEGHTGPVTCCTVFADGTRAISGSSDKTLKVWDVEAGEVIRTLRGHTGSLSCCAVFADGTRAISGSSDNTLKVWDIESGTAIQTLRGHTGSVECCAVFPDGTRAISGSWDHTLKVWDLTHL